jgi:uroporphyrinogen-III decarboxylase
MLDNLAWLDDDRVPSLHVYTGTEIFAEAFGCSVHRPTDNMPFALPCVRQAADAARLREPALDCPPLARLFARADRLLERAGPDALLQIPDVQSPLDIAALIWEKSDFYIALIEEPAAVLELTDKIRRLLFCFFDTWFARYGSTYIAHYPYYTMQGGLTVSENEVGVIGTELFERFALPDLNALSVHFGGLGIHCCANAAHQWSGFRRVQDLRLINLNQSEAVLRQAYAYFGDSVCQMHAWTGNGDPATWPEQLPAGARVVYDVPAATREEAVRLADAYRQRFGRIR